jgi:predicted dehydrogenase/threonine dehydrogenase-like Zn-dependent dehydrogenase
VQCRSRVPGRGVYFRVKQVVQNLRSGVLELLEVPCPAPARGQLLIQSRTSLISAGTERMLVEFGQASLVAKARQNPERVKQVLDKIRTDGLLPTLEAVFSKLDEPLPLGYSNAGVVVETGPGVQGFSVGDRVASNGPHAEMVCRPVNLCAKIPDPVEDDHACFAVLGAIAMQGVRLLRPELGETVAVFGLGLIGLLAVQMLAAGGAQVLGIDLDPRRLELARTFGATSVPVGEGADPVAAALSATAGHGVDGVLIAASATNDAIVSQSARMSRKRGRIVLVGVVNMELNRAEFYEKELSFQVSCSYGPGRYDAAYEEQGVDYPYGFVRWTEQRNIEAVLALHAAGRLNVAPLITQRVPHAEAQRAYDLLKTDRSQLGIVLEYPRMAAPVARVAPSKLATAGAPFLQGTAGAHGANAQAKPLGKVVVGVIGAGNFTTRALLPALRRVDVTLATIASAGGVSGAHAARKFGFRSSTTDYRTILDDASINTVFITTRHNQHARMAVEALRAGKHVLVEKPLAIDREGLQQIREAYAQASGRQLMVGFNRRFSPHAARMRQLLAARSQPACMTALVNAGQIPANHWQHDPQIGGGRIVGEGCHWFDLMSFIIDSRISAVQAVTVGGRGVETHTDHASISLTFADGSLGTLHYFANGHRSFPKERLTVFCEGRVLELDNFRRLRGYGWSNFSKQNLFRQDKGHDALTAAFVQRALHGGHPLIAPAELWNVTLASLAVQEAVATGKLVPVDG